MSDGRSRYSNNFQNWLERSGYTNTIGETPALKEVEIVRPQIIARCPVLNEGSQAELYLARGPCNFETFDKSKETCPVCGYYLKWVKYYD